MSAYDDTVGRAEDRHPGGGGIRKVNEVLLDLPPDRWITRYTCEEGDQPRYVIHGPRGSGSLSPLQLSRADAIRGAIKQATGRTVARPKVGTWLDVITTLEEDEETVDMGDFATVADRARVWITDYLGAVTVLPEHDLRDGMGTYGPHPFEHPDGVAIYAEAVATWATNQTHGERVGRTELVRGCQALGLHRETIKYEVGGRVTTRSMYVVPATL